MTKDDSNNLHNVNLLCNIMDDIINLFLKIAKDDTSFGSLINGAVKKPWVLNSLILHLGFLVH